MTFDQTQNILNNVCTCLIVERPLDHSNCSSEAADNYRNTEFKNYSKHSYRFTKLSPAL